MKSDFDELLAEAQAQHFSGWGFQPYVERWKEDPLPWDYQQQVLAKLDGVETLLDMDTGGGENLLALIKAAPCWPKRTFATELYPPNIPIAKAALEPLGITVVAPESEINLPFDEAMFDLVLNRHGGLNVDEVYRVIKPGGFFITQQVGGQNHIELNYALRGPDPLYVDWSLEKLCSQLQQAGFVILDKRECFPISTFADVGAIAFYLRVIEWQIPGYTLESYRDRLWELHERIQRDGPLKIKSHRFYVEAQKVKLSG